MTADLDQLITELVGIGAELEAQKPPPPEPEIKSYFDKYKDKKYLNHDFVVVHRSKEDGLIRIKREIAELAKAKDHHTRDRLEQEKRQQPRYKPDYRKFPKTKRR